MTDNPGTEKSPGLEEPIRIPVDNPQDDPDVDKLVRDYEARYYGFRDNEKPKVKNSLRDSLRAPLRSTSVPLYSTSADERKWAALAHGSALLTMLLGLMTGGVTTLFTIFIPLGIYFYYRQRSEYVAYQALQAFALQLLGTVGWLAILVTGMLAGALLCFVLAITIIGIVVIPFVALAMILFAVVSFALPLGMVVYGAIAGWETYQGKWYRLPWIGDWIDRQMHVGFLATL